MPWRRFCWHLCRQSVLSIIATINKPETLTQCCFNVGPASVDQHQNNIASVVNSEIFASILLTAQGELPWLLTAQGELPWLLTAQGELPWLLTAQGELPWLLTAQGELPWLLTAQGELPWLLTADEELLWLLTAQGELPAMIAQLESYYRL